MEIDALKDIPNCWDVMDCEADTCRKCPAYPDKGRECWKVTGTMCAQGRFKKTDLAEKLMHCRNNCKFYKEYISRVYP